MKHYILDTGFFIIARDYYPGTFPSFWEEVDQMVQTKSLSSVQEVYVEVANYGGEQQHLINWIQKNKVIFTQPDIHEQNKLRDIFKIRRFQQLVNKKAMMKGSTCADPFVVAKAIISGGTVVTRELPAKRNKKGDMVGAPKIPDVCNHFGVPCITPSAFMRERKWKF